MKKLLVGIAAVIYSNVILAGQMHNSEEYSTPKAVVYIVVGVILISVIAAVLYKRPKRKFNE